MSNDTQNTQKENAINDTPSIIPSIPLINTTIDSSTGMQWKEIPNGTKISTPALQIAGYAMCFVHLPAGKTMHLAGKTRVIVNCLEGSLARPAISGKECITIKNSRFIQAETDSLVFLCVDETEAEMNGDEMKSTIAGLPLKWIERETGCHRTDPKLHVGNFRVNAWYLVPNKNGGIHNHRESANNLAEQFVEFHTQLRGVGSMVIYENQDGSTETKRITLQPGDSHPLLSTIENGVVKYPWHAYVASETGGLFLVFEEINVVSNGTSKEATKEEAQQKNQ
jgi:hypothetical protein